MLGITIAYQIREKLCALSKKCTAQTQKKKKLSSYYQTTRGSQSA